MADMDLEMELSALEKRMGYTFSDKSLLRTALTHSSYANEKHVPCNERLEFLGDSVLSLTVSRYLYTTYPELPEGRLSLLRKNVVCKEALAGYGAQLTLGAFLLLGKGEAKDGREKPKLLEDAFEALLGALFLDAGDLHTVEVFLLPFIRRELQKREVELIPLEDCKTLLQQYVQQTPGEELSYRTVGEEGPDNAKIFTVCAYVNSNVFGTGTGSSIKEAEQNAAREALKRYLPK